MTATEKQMTTAEEDLLIEELSAPLEADSDQLNDLGKVVLESRDRVERIKEILKKANRNLENAENSMIQKMTDLQIPSFKNDEGVGFSHREVIFPKVLAKDREAQMKWLRENGREDVIKESVNAQTFGSMVRKEFLEADPPVPVPDFVITEPFQKLYVRVAK